MAFRAILRRCATDGFNVNKCGSVRFMASDAGESGVAPVNLIPLRKDTKKGGQDHVAAGRGTIAVAAVEDVGLVSGVPEDHIRTRTVRIYQPSKNAMQSGTNNINFWQIDFDTRERWENPLIGWTSTGDPLSNVKVDFASKEEAIAHCKKMGWRYHIQKPNVDDPKPRSYGMNFSWNKRTRVSTK